MLALPGVAVVTNDARKAYARRPASFTTVAAVY